MLIVPVMRWGPACGEKDTLAVTSKAGKGGVFFSFLDPISFAVTQRGEEILEWCLRNVEDLVRDVAIERSLYDSGCHAFQFTMPQAIKKPKS